LRWISLAGAVIAIVLVVIYLYVIVQIWKATHKMPNHHRLTTYSAEWSGSFTFTCRKHDRLVIRSWCSKPAKSMNASARIQNGLQVEMIPALHLTHPSGSVHTPFPAAHIRKLMHEISA